MAKSSSGSGSGKGPANQNRGGAPRVKTPVRTGKPANGVNPGAVSYLGNKLGNHSMDKGDMTLRATPWKGSPPVSNNVPLGNQTALAGSGAGARPGGAGRVVSPCGSQGTHSGTGAAIGARMLPGGGK
jgi:hypothetical protein